MKRVERHVLLFMLLTQLCFSQLPACDLYLLRLRMVKDSLVAEKSITISAQKGYNNQPSFSLDEKRLYFSSAALNGQSDIWYYGLKSKKTLPLASTAISEYSPQEVQSGLIYAVCVEADSSQKIHAIDALSGKERAVLTPDSVGYYSMLNADSLAYFKLTEPQSLRVYSISQEKESWLGDHPGRSFRTVNRHQLIYVLKDSLNNSIMLYDFALQKARVLATCPPASEDLFWHPRLGLLRSEKSQILQWQEKNKTWKTLLDLKDMGLKGITRFVFDRNLKQLVLVNKSGE